MTDFTTNTPLYNAISREPIVTYHYDGPRPWSITLPLSEAEHLARDLNDKCALQYFFPAIRRVLK